MADRAGDIVEHKLLIAIAIQKRYRDTIIHKALMQTI